MYNGKTTITCWFISSVDAKTCNYGYQFLFKWVISIQVLLTYKCHFTAAAAAAVGLGFLLPQTRDLCCSADFQIININRPFFSVKTNQNKVPCSRDFSNGCLGSESVGIWMVKPFGHKPACLLLRLLPACVRVCWLSCVVDLLVLCACVEWVKQATTIIAVWLGVLRSSRFCFIFSRSQAPGFRCPGWLV